jgi:hypothetical protein
MDTDFSLADNPHRLGEYATHPRVRPDKRLVVSLLLAGPGPQRTRKGQAGAVEPLKRQQPRSRRFVPDTRPNAPSSASNCCF